MRPARLPWRERRAGCGADREREPARAGIERRPNDGELAEHRRGEEIERGSPLEQKAGDIGGGPCGWRRRAQFRSRRRPSPTWL